MPLPEQVRLDDVPYPFGALNVVVTAAGMFRAVVIVAHDGRSSTFDPGTGTWYIDEPSPGPRWPKQCAHCSRYGHFMTCCYNAGVLTPPGFSRYAERRKHRVNHRILAEADPPGATL